MYSQTLVTNDAPWCLENHYDDILLYCSYSFSMDFVASLSLSLVSSRAPTSPYFSLSLERSCIVKGAISLPT